MAEALHIDDGFAGFRMQCDTNLAMAKTTHGYSFVSFLKEMGRVSR